MMKKSKKWEISVSKLIDTFPKNHGEWLELCIKFTKRAMRSPPLDSDKWLVDQETKLTKQLEQWRKNESKS